MATNSKLTIHKLKDSNQTAKEMVRIVKMYCSDLGNKKNWSLIRFFDFVKNLPYVRDPVLNETISRPKLLLLPNWHARDCDD